jgi:hypothetical protein
MFDDTKWQHDFYHKDGMVMISNIGPDGISSTYIEVF